MVGQLLQCLRRDGSVVLWRGGIYPSTGRWYMSWIKFMGEDIWMLVGGLGVAELDCRVVSGQSLIVNPIRWRVKRISSPRETHHFLMNNFGL